MAGRSAMCPTCGRPTQVMTSFAEHVEVIEGRGGAITTRTEQRLERRCGWCGALVADAVAVAVEDLPPL